ncbi:inositol-pentakisphosphate 2-kinase [Mycena amicta]|nr:inositol-pentakisphosphate 2-kinase [Mycena amicta]
MALVDTSPSDWAYLSEGGATIVFSYHGPASEVFDGTVLRLRKCAVAAKESDSNELTTIDDLSVVFHKCCIERLIPREHLVRLQQLSLSPSSQVVEWLETLAAQAEDSRPAERRKKDGIDVRRPRAVLATDLVGGDGIAVDIKPKWGFLPSPIHLSDQTRPIKTRTCRFCMHSHLRAQQGQVVSTGYCPLDLYSGDEIRVGRALEALWEAWTASDGGVINLRVFVKGRKVSPAENLAILEYKDRLMSSLRSILLRTPVLRTISRLQRTLDALDIEGLASICDLSSPGPEPTMDGWDAFVSEYLTSEPTSSCSDNNNRRYHILAYLLSATFKDCSIIVRIPEGTVTIIDLDVKSIDRLRKWEKLDREIVDAYGRVPEEQRRQCVDAVNSDGLD